MVLKDKEDDEIFGYNLPKAAEEVKTYSRNDKAFEKFYKERKTF